jgi:hypothetical protein
MHDQEKSDSAIVAVKRPNKTGISVAEAVEPRAGTKGNAGQQSTFRTQTRDRVAQALTAYGKQQGKGRRSGSPRFSTMSTSRRSGWRSMRSSAKPPQESMA